MAFQNGLGCFHSSLISESVKLVKMLRVLEQNTKKSAVSKC